MADHSDRMPAGTTDRIPPHNLEAERSLLGAMMVSAEAAGSALETVTADDFSRAAHGRIFEAIRHLFSRGEPVDQITVAARLEANAELDQVGDRDYILELVNATPLAANAVHYGHIVKRTAILRRLIGAATDIAALGYAGPDDVDEVIEKAEKRLFDVTNERVESRFQRIRQLLVDGWDKLAELSERQEHLTGVTSGFAPLDRLLAGLHRGDLIVLAARPAVGKTAFALNVAVNAAKSGVRVGIFSLEMSAEQLVLRMLATEAQVNGQNLRTGRLSDSDWPKLFDAMGRLDKCDLYIDDSPALSILELRAKARRLFRGCENGLIIVDYLQLMQPQQRRSENRQVEIAEISRGLKILSKELNVPVIALSQLSRAVEQRQDKRPVLSDLRESGAIEQDSDVVMFIHRDTTRRDSDEPAPNMPARGTAEIILAKHRNGPTGDLTLIYHPEYMRFVEGPTMPRRPDVPAREYAPEGGLASEDDLPPDAL